MSETQGPLHPGPAARSAQERILDVVAPVVDRVGYVHLTVEQILRAAPASRATFYQYFGDVDDCFWSAYRRHAQELCEQVTAELDRGGPPELEALDALACFAVTRPAPARMLMRESLAAGPAGLVERDILIETIESIIRGAPGPRPTVDLPLSTLIGGAFRFLSMRLSGAQAMTGAGGELRAWVHAFPAARERPSWSERFWPVLPEPTTQAAFGRIRREGSTRERILRGTALAIRAEGYHAVTVQDITAAAGVSRRRFYGEFSSKGRAFIAAYEHGFQETMAACAPAFFAAREWRERVWRGALAFTGFFAAEPLFAHLGLVECYALGPDFTLRVHDTQLAFTLFLEDGYRERPAGESLPRSFSALTAATIFELAFQGSRRGPRFEMRRLQPLAVYIALAPFIGPGQAGEFVAGKLALGPGGRDVSSAA